MSSLTHLLLQQEGDDDDGPAPKLQIQRMNGALPVVSSKSQRLNEALFTNGEEEDLPSMADLLKELDEEVQEIPKSLPVVSAEHRREHELQEQSHFLEEDEEEVVEVLPVPPLQEVLSGLERFEREAFPEVEEVIPGATPSSSSFQPWFKTTSDPRERLEEAFADLPNHALRRPVPRRGPPVRQPDPKPRSGHYGFEFDVHRKVVNVHNHDDEESLAAAFARMSPAQRMALMLGKGQGRGRPPKALEGGQSSSGTTQEPLRPSERLPGCRSLQVATAPAPKPRPRERQPLNIPGRKPKEELEPVLLEERGSPVEIRPFRCIKSGQPILYAVDCQKDDWAPPLQR